MTKVNKILNLISTIICVVMIVSLYIFIMITGHNYFNGYMILIFLCMLLNPIINLLKLNKKIIINPIYYFILIGLSSYVSYISINSLLIYNKYLNDIKDNSYATNIATYYFSERFLYILIAIILILLLAFIFKKHNVKSNKDNSKLILIIIFLTAAIPILTRNMELISASFAITQLIFVIIIFFKLRSINTASELRGYYLILIITSILSLNPISLVLSICIFIQLDTFGLHI